MLHYFRDAVLIGFVLCLVLTIATAAQDESVIRRAAFDIGSSSIKCTVADVDTATGDIVKVVKEYSRKVDFAEDMARSYDGNFSHAVMDQGMAALKELKLKALDLNAKSFSAIGSTTIRDARNGRAYFATIENEVGMSCRIISKQQAAMLCYHAVRQEKDIQAQDLLVWDIGGSSQQMIARALDGSLAFYIDKMASVSFKNAVIRTIQDKDIITVSSPNPISEPQANRALQYVETHARMNVTPLLANRIKGGSMQVVGIGGVHNYAIPELLGESKPAYTHAEVKATLGKWINRPDADFKSEYASSRLTNLILVLGYMNALGIDSISPLKVNQAEGLLVSPEYW